MTENTLVLFMSKNGASKAYATEIAKRLNLEPIALKAVKKQDLSGCDTLIYCAGIYISKIKGLKKLKKLTEKHPVKTIHLFIAGLSDDSAETIAKLKKDNQADFPEPAPSITYARGTFDVKKMGLPTRLMMRFLHRILSKKSDLNPEEKGLLEAIDTPVYAVDLTKTDALINRL